jgi:putative hydrolase of the HAD superfamily
MLAQSQPYPQILDLVRALKARYGLKVAVVANDGREFIVHRVKQFGLKEFVYFFVVSCFVHCRKPEPDLFQRRP